MEELKVLRKMPLTSLSIAGDAKIADLEPLAGMKLTQLQLDGCRLVPVRDFVGTNGPDGKDLLVYPVVNEWDLERDAKPVSE